MSFYPGIVICTRLDSTRLPKKVLRKLNGIPIIVHLLRQIIPLNIPIVLAMPMQDEAEYVKVLSEYPDVWPKIHILPSTQCADPLARMAQAQKHYGFSHVVRITHDKIFIDTAALLKALSMAKEIPALEYIYGPTLIPGTGFEIIEGAVLQKTAEQFKLVEHITYAVRLVANKTATVEGYNDAGNTRCSLLIDFPEDLKLMEVLFATLGDKITLKDVFEYLSRNQELININLAPYVTIYMCAYNAEKYIQQAMESVQGQRFFNTYYEFIIIDDHSTDRTCELIARFSIDKPNVHWFRNSINIGLASSSNKALSFARGKFIIRLDADDFFTDDDVIYDLTSEAEQSNLEAVYPDNYFGSVNRVQKGRESHHVGGALFNRNALNFIKFTDGLRNYEGLDLFTRAKDRLKIGYFEQPTFMYRQHEGSMSKTNLEERAETKLKIEGYHVPKV